jgi:hypothetical protein
MNGDCAGIGAVTISTGSPDGRGMRVKLTEEPIAQIYCPISITIEAPERLLGASVAKGDRASNVGTTRKK